MKTRLPFLSVILASVTATAAPQMVTTEAALGALDFSKTKVIFIGETSHYDTSLQPVEVKILEAIDASNKAPRKCLLLEADSQFDEAFQVLSKSTSQDALAKANAILDTHDMMTESIHWIGDTYPLSQFEFAVKHGWTVRSGDMIHSNSDHSPIDDGKPEGEQSDYHIVYLRNQFMTKRITGLLKTDCNLIVGLYGATHLSYTAKLPSYKLDIVPVPMLLEKKSIHSTSVFAVNPNDIATWSTPSPVIHVPETIVALPAP